MRWCVRTWTPAVVAVQAVLLAGRERGALEHRQRAPGRCRPATTREIAGTPAGFAIMISIGALKLVTGVPASAQRAVTSTICVPARSRSRHRPGGAVDAQDDEVGREGGVGHAAAGTVTETRPPGTDSVESPAAVMLRSTGGGSRRRRSGSRPRRGTASGCRWRPRARRRGRAGRPRASRSGR